MEKFTSGYKLNASGDFLTRYANLRKATKVANSHNEKAEFDVGYKKGTLRLAIASKFLKLAKCGCDRYVEEDAPHIVWAKDGDSIIRVEDDLSWVDEFLEGENNATN